MITDQVLSKIETTLKEIFPQSHIVPEGEAYPTSGASFIRITGDYTEIEQREHDYLFRVHFSVICSVRTRDYMTQNKATPYTFLLDQQERCFFWIITNQSLIADIRTIAEGATQVTGRFETDMLNTRVQVLDERFFGSNYKPHTSHNSDRESGYLLSQTYASPKIIVPAVCMELGSPFDQTPT